MRNLFLFTAMAASLFATDVPKQGAVPRKAPEFVFNMVGKPQQLLSMYKGKPVVLAFMYTTCPHCQKLAQLLAQLQVEYAPKGVQVLGATFDTDAKNQVDAFNKKLGVNFPCGYSSTGPVLEFLQHPDSEPYFVPILVFIDKAGIIRSQYIGDEAFLSKPDVNIRAEIEKLLKPGAPVSRAASKTAPKS